MQIYSMDEVEAGPNAEFTAFVSNFVGIALNHMPISLSRQISFDDPNDTIPFSEEFKSNADLRTKIIEATWQTLAAMAVPKLDPEPFALLTSIVTMSLIIDMAPGVVPVPSESFLRTGIIDSSLEIVPIVTTMDNVLSALDVRNNPLRDFIWAGQKIIEDTTNKKGDRRGPRSSTVR